MNRANIFDNLHNDIMNSSASETEKSNMLRKLLQLEKQQLNIMITGGTGCGKSSTINALFNVNCDVFQERTKVGVGADPETKDIQKYDLGNLILWDTPGLGDGVNEDKRHAELIARKLHEQDNSGQMLIDLVMVIIDGSNRDMNSSFNLINDVVIPNLGIDKKNRLVVAINQADVAIKGKKEIHWRDGRPDRELVDFLEKKVTSVKGRIKESTGIDCEPIYYSAGDMIEGKQEKPYNLSKLLYCIIKSIPSTKRLSAAEHLNQDKEKWQNNDGQKNYNKSIGRLILDALDAVKEKASDFVSWGLEKVSNVLDFLLP